MNTSLDVLSTLLSGRSRDLCANDMLARDRDLHEQLAGIRVLVIGGAGSIGAATVRLLVNYGPSAVHVVDQNENSLAELTRDLRAMPPDKGLNEFITLPFDFGSPVMHRWLRSEHAHDLVLNFAALKHVRSEKNVYSALQLLDTNVVKHARLIRWLSERGPAFRYFAVSTDKAANPVNLMGASKRLMEHVVLAKSFLPLHASSTCARFANVAFSAGSLLESFVRRLEKTQPLAVPRETRRFFISLREAGQICLLSAVCAPSGHTVIPRPGSELELCDLESIATTFVLHHGMMPHFCEDEAEARACARTDREAGRYPILLTPLDTSGEKPYEEFVGVGERPVEIGLEALLGIEHVCAPDGALVDLVEELAALVAGEDGCLGKSDLVNRIAGVVPEFRHVETGKSLDDRM